MNAYELKRSAIEALEWEVKYYIESNGDLPDVDDVDITELAYGLVPVYTIDLIDLLRSDYGLFGWTDPELGGYKNIDEIISWNAFRYIEQIMYSEFDNIINEIDI